MPCKEMSDRIMIHNCPEEATVMKLASINVVLLFCTTPLLASDDAGTNKTLVARVIPAKPPKDDIYSHAAPEQRAHGKQDEWNACDINLEEQQCLLSTRRRRQLPRR
jgi:hypothetical protein